MVRLSFKNAPIPLGDSKTIAIKRFLMLGKKLKINMEFQAQYKQFMREYEEMIHMSIINEEHCKSNTQYFLPHHGVWKPESL